MSAPATSHDVPPQRPGVLAAWLCASLGLGCAGAQVPPQREDCPREAREAMEKLGLDERSGFYAQLDLRQPPGESGGVGIYEDGPVVSRIVKQHHGPQELPEGTLLHGRFWTGPGIDDGTTPRPGPGVMGRYTRAVLPDGRSFPVCIVLGARNGRVGKYPGSTPELTLLGRVMPLSAVWWWP